MASNPVVTFGSSEDSFYVGCGLKYVVAGMPQSLVDTVSKLPAVRIPWLSIDANTEVWVARDSYKSSFLYNNGVPNDISEKLKGTAEYVTFGPTKDSFFVRLASGTWTANLLNDAVEVHKQLSTRLGPNFETAITGIIFGKGKTLIYCLQVGFLPLLDDDAKGGDLKKVLKEREDQELRSAGIEFLQKEFAMLNLAPHNSL